MLEDSPPKSSGSGSVGLDAKTFMPFEIILALGAGVASSIVSALVAYNRGAKKADLEARREKALREYDKLSEEQKRLRKLVDDAARREFPELMDAHL